MRVRVTVRMELDHRVLFPVPRIQHLGRVLRRRSGADRAHPGGKAPPRRCALAAPVKKQNYRLTALEKVMILKVDPGS